MSFFSYIFVQLGKHAMRDAAFETLLTYGMIRNKSIDSLDLRW